MEEFSRTFRRPTEPLTEIREESGFRSPILDMTPYDGSDLNLPAINSLAPMILPGPMGSAYRHEMQTPELPSYEPPFNIDEMLRHEKC